MASTLRFVYCLHLKVELTVTASSLLNVDVFKAAVDIWDL